MFINHLVDIFGFLFVNICKNNWFLILSIRLFQLLSMQRNKFGQILLRPGLQTEEKRALFKQTARLKFGTCVGCLDKSPSGGRNCRQRRGRLDRNLETTARAHYPL